MKINVFSFALDAFHSIPTFKNPITLFLPLAHLLQPMLQNILISLANRVWPRRDQCGARTILYISDIIGHCVPPNPHFFSCHEK